MRLFLLLPVFFLPVVAFAEPWTFSDPITVAGEADAPHYHHLVGAAVAVAPVEDHPYQGYPAAAWTREGRLMVAWEDRRAGHTRLFRSGRGAGQDFDPERQLNEHFEPPPGGREPVGLGSGVMRVALAADGGGSIRAIWLDKRDAKSGSAIPGFAATLTSLG